MVHDAGCALVEKVSWDAYHEAQDLKTHAQRYHDRHGQYPERILADKIYRTRENRQWCAKHGIRLAGVGPGRPPKDTTKRKAIQREARKDEADRQPIEGIFGRGKRRFGLKRLLTRLTNTSENVIALVMIVMNLERIIRLFILFLI